MAWVVDTCLLIDVAEADPSFGVSSAQGLDRLRTDGLIICPVSYVELAPVFNGDEMAQQEFLYHLSVGWREPWTEADTRASATGWHRHVVGRRTGSVRKRPVADVLIGGFAVRFQGLLTRNPSDFRTIFPRLTIRTP
jgi:predicted nucleic acid-binding protein